MKKDDNTQTYAYVASYQVTRFKFGNDIEKLSRSVQRVANYISGSAVLYRVKEDGSWERLNLGRLEKEYVEKKYETL